MSLSTSCSLFWVDVHDNVVEVDNDDAVCDDSYTSCTITGSHGGTLDATCNSELQYPDTTSSYYTSYFCACNGNSVSVPSGVTCSPSCYDLTTPFSTCNIVWLYNGFTSGSDSNIVKQDTCSAFTCDSDGIECTDSSNTLLYQCDNEEHQSQVASDSNDSYVCNCQGAAQIPELYRGSSGGPVGTGCDGSTSGGDSEPSTTTDNSGPSTTTDDSGPSTTTDDSGPSATGDDGESVTSAQPTGAGAVATTTTAVTSTGTPASSSSNSGSQGSASSSLFISKVMLLSLYSSLLLRLLYH